MVEFTTDGANSKQLQGLYRWSLMPLFFAMRINYYGNRNTRHKKRLLMRSSHTYVELDNQWYCTFKKENVFCRAVKSFRNAYVRMSTRMVFKLNFVKAYIRMTTRKEKNQ